MEKTIVLALCLGFAGSYAIHLNNYDDGGFEVVMEMTLRQFFGFH